MQCRKGFVYQESHPSTRPRMVKMLLKSRKTANIYSKRGVRTRHMCVPWLELGNEDEENKKQEKVPPPPDVCYRVSPFAFSDWSSADLVSSHQYIILFLDLACLKKRLARGWMQSNDLLRTVPTHPGSKSLRNV